MSWSSVVSRLVAFSSLPAAVFAERSGTPRAPASPPMLPRSLRFVESDPKVLPVAGSRLVPPVV